MVANGMVANVSGADKLSGFAARKLSGYESEQGMVQEPDKMATGDQTAVRGINPAHRRDAAP